MRDPLEYVQQLAVKARAEQTSTRGAIAPAVLARLHDESPSLDRPLAFFVMIAATAAAASVLMALYLNQFTTADSLGTFFDVASSITY